MRVLAVASAPAVTALDDWFLSERGIRSQTLDRFDIGRQDDTVTIPYRHGTKTRKGTLAGKREFFTTQGFKVELFNQGMLGLGGTAFLVEGETDAMRLYQELQDAGKIDVPVVGLPGIENWKSEFADLFSECDRIYVVLDADQDYNVRSRVDQAWLKIRRDLGVRSKRVKLDSAHVKDLCEFFQAGFELADLNKLIQKPVSRYHPLDLRDAHIPRPVNWMVEGLLGQGDVTLMFGDPGVGKSWLSMSLALAVAQGADTWLGKPLHQHGNVLYIDEENPEDVVYERLHKLGLQHADTNHLRFLHEQGIRMDKDPDALLEEALAFEPKLIVLDSLTRIHTENENDAGAIARLFNDGIKPLARQTGATVLLLHHSRKPSNDPSSFARARGSGDITASADTGLDIRAVGPGYMNVVHYKSRRMLPGHPTGVRIMDQEDGGVRLVTNHDMPPPF